MWCFLTRGGWGWRLLLTDVLDGCEVDNLRIGDLLNANLTGTTEGIPTVYFTDHIQWLGHGTDLLGEDFLRVIRHEQINEPIVAYTATSIPEGITYDVVPVNTGDVDEDELLSIIDVILLNRYLLGSLHYLPCQKLAADVDDNGEIDPTDSLTILKEVVGITVNFEEQST